MTNEKLKFVEILKSFVHETPFTDEDMTTEDWINILQLAAIHSDNGIVAYIMKMNPSESNMPLNAQAHRILMQTISVYANRAESMKSLILQMNDAGIDHLLFKGFIVRELYSIPELRTFGDIDFLIRKEDRQKMHQFMLEQGYEVHDDWEPVYSYARGMEYYEVHSHVMEIDVSDKADYRGYFDHIWEHAICTEGHSYILDLEYHLIYLLTHLAKHINSSGAGIRMYLDIALYIKAYRDQIDWEHFKKELRKLAFEDYVNMVFSAVEQWFDVKSPIELKSVEAAIMEDYLDFTMDGGVFGHVGRTSGESWLKRDERNDTEDVSKAKTLIHRLFPSANKIETRYTYLQGRHWLLPVAWVHRLFKTRSSWGDHAKQAQDIMNADTEEILKMRRLYKKIGL